jgi:hypothetical protein
MKKEKLKRILFKLVVVLIGIYLVFAITRYSRYTTYIPFAGRVFDLDSEEITGIQINRQGDLYYVEGEEIQRVAEIFNAFRYKACVPIPPIQNCGDYRVFIDFDDGESIRFHVNENGAYARGVWYFAAGDYLDAIVEEMENLPPDPPVVKTPLPASNGDVNPLPENPTSNSDL